MSEAKYYFKNLIELEETNFSTLYVYFVHVKHLILLLNMVGARAGAASKFSRGY
jgi:hypothetical protein